MVRGEGCLFWATGPGTRESGVTARPVRRVPPAYWDQYCASAWTASWTRLQGHEVLGPREILERPEWAAEVRWRDHVGSHRATHRPGLIAILDDGYRFAIEFELTRTSPGRRRANLAQHAAWCSRGMSSHLYYLCADARGCERIRKEARAVGLSEDRGTLAVAVVSAIKPDALRLFSERRATSRRVTD
jgi:hypothetical protein